MIVMKRIFVIISTILLCVNGFAQKQKYVVGFYNLENLFDIYDEPGKNDEESSFLMARTNGLKPNTRRNFSTWRMLFAR